jgi:hypothetical protein
MHISLRPAVALTFGALTYGLLFVSVQDFAINVEFKKSFFVTTTALYITYIAYHEFD